MDEKRFLEGLRSLDWGDIGTRLLIYTRAVAANKYRWHEGNPLPEGKTPEDIAREAIYKFWSGARKHNPKYAVQTVLQGVVRSTLCNLYRKKEAMTTDQVVAEELEQHADTGANPGEQVESEDLCNSILKALYEDEKVKSNESVMLVVMAYDDNAEDVDQVVAKTGLSKSQVYEVRKQLKLLYPKIKGKLV